MVDMHYIITNLTELNTVCCLFHCSRYSYAHIFYSANNGFTYGLLILGMLTWVELAQFMRIFANVKMHPVLSSLISILCRGVIIVCDVKYWFIGACVIYLVFSIPVSFAIVNARFVRVFIFFRFLIRQRCCTLDMLNVFLSLSSYMLVSRRVG